MINNLDEASGFEYTSKLSRIFTDMNLSKGMTRALNSFGLQVDEEDLRRPERADQSAGDEGVDSGALKTVEEDRRFVIQARIVRVMKVCRTPKTQPSIPDLTAVRALDPGHQGHRHAARELV